MGMTHPDVKELQKFLNGNGYPVSLSGVGSLGNETTYFGLKTKSAVMLFQTAKGLTPDGSVGPMTRSYLNNPSPTDGQTPSSPTENPPSNPNGQTSTGCTLGALFNTITGQPCSTTPPPTASTYPAGCTSTSGFSVTTGLSCGTTTPTPTITYPAGCTSTSGFSVTTGVSCATGLPTTPVTTTIIAPTIVSGGGSSSHHYTQLTIANPTLTLSKTYDGSTTAEVTAGALSGVDHSDTVTVSVVATYDNKNVGTGKTITVVYTIGGADASSYIKPVNYTVATGEITAKDITVTADSSQTKVYGATDPTFTYTTPGLVGSDTLSGALSRASGSNVGTYAITIGTLANTNYDITLVSANFSITTKAITVTANSSQT